MKNLSFDLKKLTVNRIILYLFILFVLHMLINFLLDPASAIEAFKEGWNSVPPAR